MQVRGVKPNPSHITLPILRKRHNPVLYAEACKPLTEIRGTEHDYWQGWDSANHCYITNPNPVWEAALDLFERRLDCYWQLIPLKDWPKA